MSTLIGPLRIVGPMGALTFYTTKNGKTIVRQKGGPSRQRVLTHRNFERSRENFADFGSVSRLAGNIRRTFGPYLTHLSEGTYFNRLVGLLRMISDTDPYNAPGMLSPLEGNVHLLEDFQWNANLAFTDALQAEYTSNVDVVTGKLSLDFQSFVPIAAVKAPARATHFQVILKGAVVCPGKDSPVYMPDASPLFALNGSEIGPLSLSLDLNTQDGALIMLGAGIVFYEEVMGIPMMLRGGACQIISVERIPSNKETAEADISQDTAVETSPGSGGASPAPKRKTRQEAMEIMMSSMHASGYGMGRIIPPITKNVQAAQQMEEKILQVKRRLWLNKLEKYRRG